MEDEIRSLRRDLAKFIDWAKQSHELNQRNLSIINENFNLLLKLFVSKNGAVTFENLQCISMTNKDEIEAESKNSERASSPLSYEAVKDFSDDEDVEESLRINPISLKVLPVNNKKKLTARVIIKKLNVLEKPNSVTDETLISTEANSTSETSINSKSDISLESGRKGRRPKITLTGKKLEQFLSELKRERENSRKKYPNALQLPDSYLEYGAARGWRMKLIKLKYYNDRAKAKPKAKQTRKVYAAKNRLKNRLVNVRYTKGARTTPVLNLTPEQLKAALKELREEQAKRKIRPFPDFYFQFGAARGWNLGQVARKYYNDCRDLANRMKCDKNVAS